MIAIIIQKFLYQLVAQVCQPYQILLDIQLESVATPRHQPHQLLHLLFAGELLVFQVVGEAGQEADPAGGVGPQVGILPVAVLGQLLIQLPGVQQE